MFEVGSLVIAVLIYCAIPDLGKKNGSNNPKILSRKLADDDCSASGASGVGERLPEISEIPSRYGKLETAFGPALLLLPRKKQRGSDRTIDGKEKGRLG